MAWDAPDGTRHYETWEDPNRPQGPDPQFTDDSGLGKYTGGNDVFRYEGKHAERDIVQGDRALGDRQRVAGPIPGYDNRDWEWLKDPDAFEYGGYEGGDKVAIDRYRGLANAADARAGVRTNDTAYNADMALAAQRGQAQNYALDRYRGMIEGTAVTPAQMQMQRGLATSLGYTGSQVAGARGAGNNLASAQAASADAAAQQTGAYSDELARLKQQEAMGAIRGYGDVATQRRAQDLQRTHMAGEQASRNAQLEAQQRELNDKRAIENERRARDVFKAQLASQQAGEEAEHGWVKQHIENVQRRRDQEDSNTRAFVGGFTSMGGGVISGVGSAAGTSTRSSDDDHPVGSDVRLKKDIEPAGGKVDEALDAMSPYGYRYKQPEKHGKGEQVGPMAQDLAATPAGRTAVAKMPGGKLGIDVGQGTKLALAGAARLNQRVRQLEGQQKQATVAPVQPMTGPGAYSYMPPEYLSQHPELKGQLRDEWLDPQQRASLAAAHEDFKKRDAEYWAQRSQPQEQMALSPYSAPARTGPVGPTPTGQEIASAYTPHEVPYYGPTQTGEEIASGILGPGYQPQGLARVRR